MEVRERTRLDSTQFWVAVQLAATHGTAAFAALALAMLLGGAGVPVWALFGVALVSGGLAGLLLTLNLQQGLQVVQSALERLSGGQPLASLPQRLWPMTGLLERVDAVGERVREYGQRREQLLRQVGETAAQEERNRLARDLHDSIKQQLFSISAGAATVEARWQKDQEGAL